MQDMELKLGPNSHEYARKMDEDRVCAAEKNLLARLVKPGFVIDKNKRKPWTLQLLQVLHFMAQESMIQCKLKKNFFFHFYYHAFFSKPCFQSPLSRFLANCSTDLNEILHRSSRHNVQESK